MSSNLLGIPFIRLSPEFRSGIFLKLIQAFKDTDNKLHISVVKIMSLIQFKLKNQYIC